MFYVAAVGYYVLMIVLLYVSALFGFTVAYVNRQYFEGMLFEPGILIASTVLVLSCAGAVLLVRDLLREKTPAVVGNDIVYSMSFLGFSFVYGYVYVRVGEFDPRLWEAPWTLFTIFVFFTTALFVWLINGHTNDDVDPV